MTKKMESLRNSKFKKFENNKISNLDVFKGDRVKMNTFFEQVCTMDWNENQDAGYPLSQAPEDRIGLFPEYKIIPSASVSLTNWPYLSCL